MDQEVAELVGYAGLVAPHPDDTRDAPQSLRVGGGPASDDQDGHAAPGRRSPDSPAGFGRGCGGDRATVHHHEVRPLVGAGRAQAVRLENLAELLRLVLIDFTAKSS